MRDELPGWVRFAIVGGTGAAVFVLELRRALRPGRRESKLRHVTRNLAIAATAGLVLNLIERPLALRVARAVERRELGFVPQLVKSPVARVLLGAVLLDYGLYVWHVLTHKAPFLWRFHLVHHIDLDLDASTALRFHFGEMLLSVPWRVAQIRLVGASPMAVSVWQTLLLASILFHHSNVCLPLRLERWLRFAVMTPRLHGIHHRAEESCLNSNWSSGLALWDLLHGTSCWREDDRGIIGVPGYNRIDRVILSECLTLPFRAASRLRLSVD